jgi:predicted permease
LIIAIGYGWRFFNPGGLDRNRVRHVLSTAVLNVFLPALAFGLVVSARAISFVSIPLAGGAVVILSTVAGFVVYKLLPGFRNIPGPTFGVMILAAAYGNVTYLGLPVITEMFGAEYGYVAILYDLLASTPLLLTAGVFISARYGSGKTVSFIESLKRVVMLPPLWAVVAGIAVRLSGTAVPQLVLDTVGLMGRAVIPIMTFTVGLALDFRDVKRLPVAIPALAIKLFLAPVLAWWIGLRLGIAGNALRAVIIEGSMPVMVLSLVIADELDLDVPIAAACIAVSTVALFFTMPVITKILF